MVHGHHGRNLGLFVLAEGWNKQFFRRHFSNVKGNFYDLDARRLVFLPRGVGFRMWSNRKETRGASWGWFPYGNSRDARLGGLIPVFTDTPPQRLAGNKEWTTLTHEFELRQPLADLQIQCALQGSLGAAWFDLASLKIRRVALNVSKSAARGD